MCQLLGMNCNSPAAITFSFTGFAERGGRTADHADGWGLGFHGPEGCRVFHDDRPACESPLAAFLRGHAIKSTSALAHVRKATQGAVRLANCHPFQREWLGRTWLFATNGDLRGFDAPLHGLYRPVGTTDSEYAFCWLMQELRERFAGRCPAPDWPELAPHVAELSGRIARHGNFNFLLADGRALYAHCSSRLQLLQRRHPFPTARLLDCELALDLGTMNSPADRMVIVATEPLTAVEPWQSFASGDCRVFVDGGQVWRDVNRETRAFPPPGSTATLTASESESSEIA
jgi:glutamine amidotransferase